MENVTLLSLPWRVLQHRYDFDLCSYDPSPDTPPPGGGTWLLGHAFRWLRDNNPVPGQQYVISTRYLKRLPQNWLEAGLVVRLAKPSREELADICGFDDCRLDLCSMDPMIAQEASLAFIERFQHIFDQILQEVDAIAVYQITTELLEQSESTQVCCFEYLTQRTQPLLGRNIYWQECHRISHKSRERLLKRKSYGIKIQTALTRWYAYAKAAHEIK